MPQDTHSPDHTDSANLPASTAPSTATTSRRTLLTALSTTTLAALAGCLGDDDSGDNSTATDSPTNGSGQTPGDDTDDDSSTGNGSDTGDDDSSTGNGDDSSSGNGSDTGDDDSSSGNGSDTGDDDSSSGNGDDSSSGNGDDSSSGNGDDDTGDPAQSTLQDLRIGELPVATTLGLGDDEPISVTLVSQADTAHEFTVNLAVVPSDDDNADPAYADSQSIPLDPGDDQRVTFGAVTPDLDAGAYDIIASTSTDEAATELFVAGTTEVTLRVLLQSADGQPAQSGKVTIHDGDTTVATTPIPAESHPTVELLGTESTSYTATVQNVNGGIFPDTTTQFDLGGTNPADGITLDIVAGYPLNGNGNYRFTGFLVDEDGGPGGQPFEAVAYGSGANPTSYHAYYIDGSINGGPSFSIEDTPPEYGANLNELQSELGTTPPAHSLMVGFSNMFFYAGTRDRWEPADGIFNMNSFGHGIAGTGLSNYAKYNPGKYQYVRSDTVRGTDVDVYEVPKRDATVYVNPETGLIRRYEASNPGEDESGPNSYEVLEFFDYGEIDTVDWGLIKDRSQHETGENVDGEELEKLPWEIVDTDGE